jgi:hypothetical protein
MTVGMTGRRAGSATRCGDRVGTPDLPLRFHPDATSNSCQPPRTGANVYYPDPEEDRMTTEQTTEHTDTLADIRDQQRAAHTAGLRALADLIDAHPDLYTCQTVLHNVFVGDLARMVELAASVGGVWTKGGSESFLWLQTELGPTVQVAVNVCRFDVCEQRVTATTREVPDPELVASLPTIPETVETVEWVCPDSWLEAGR